MRSDRDKRTETEKEIDDFLSKFENPADEIDSKIDSYLDAPMDSADKGKTFSWKKVDEVDHTASKRSNKRSKNSSDKKSSHAKDKKASDAKSDAKHDPVKETKSGEKASGKKPVKKKQKVRKKKSSVKLLFRELNSLRFGSKPSAIFFKISCFLFKSPFKR